MKERERKRKLTCIYFLVFPFLDSIFHLSCQHPGKNYSKMLKSCQLVSSPPIIYFFVCIILFTKSVRCYTTTTITFEYYTSSSNYQTRIEDSRTNGIVSTKGSQLSVSWGQAFALVDAAGNYDGCQEAIHPSNYSNGIAIIQRGGNCTFSVKITRAKQSGAAG